MAKVYKREQAKAKGFATPMKVLQKVKPIQEPKPKPPVPTTPIINNNKIPEELIRSQIETNQILIELVKANKMEGVMEVLTAPRRYTVVRDSDNLIDYIDSTILP